IEVPTSYDVNRDWPVDTLPLVRNQKVFSDYGVTVLGVQPSKLEVRIDELVEREARVVGPPGVKNYEATFDPPTVKVRGPLSVLNKAIQAAKAEGGRLVLYAEIPDRVLQSPSHYDLDTLLLTRPPDLLDERVAIIAPSKAKASIDVT